MWEVVFWIYFVRFQNLTFKKDLIFLADILIHIPKNKLPKDLHNLGAILTITIALKDATNNCTSIQFIDNPLTINKEGNPFFYYNLHNILFPLLLNK